MQQECNKHATYVLYDDCQTKELTTHLLED